MSAALPTRDELKRKALFVPCNTKEALRRWIRIYLGIDFPDSKIDPASTSSPMDTIWEIYSAALNNNRPDMSEIMAYSSRDSYKTLGAAVLEVLMVVHGQRDVAHMAAIESQASKAQQYVKKAFNRPYLRDYVTSKNERKIEILHYYNKETGEQLSLKEWLAIPIGEQDNFEEISNYINIIICTVAGANSEHVPFMVIDEVDVVPNPEAYEEAKFIPASRKDKGQRAITLLTSTRKYSWALVQKELDAADETGLVVRHWNILDVTERCPEERHKPNEPRVTLYRSDDTLKTLTEGDYELLDDVTKAKYVKQEAFAGCKNCRIFAACQGRLTKQTDKSTLLKEIDHIINQFRKVSVEKAKAQLLCWKPSEEGLVFGRFSREIHMKSAAQMAEMVTGEKHDPKLTKAQLIDIFKARGCQFVTGMDFGFTHNFACVTMALDGRRAYVVDVISAPELELAQKIELCQQRLTVYNPIIYADTAYPSDIKSFKKAGFSMRDWSKEKDSVTGGIEIVRMKLMPAVGEPELYLLKESAETNTEGVSLLAHRMSHYHWKMDAAGKMLNIPDDDDDDECDALRYAIMNTFKPKGKMSIGSAKIDKPLPQQKTQQNWAQQVILEHIGQSADPVSAPIIRGRKGKLSYNF